MTVSTSSQKSARVAERKRVYNKPVRSSLKSQLKAAESLINSKDKEKAGPAVKEAVSALDRAAQKKLIHRNTAGRRKSRLVTKLHKIQIAKVTKRAKKKES